MSLKDNFNKMDGTGSKQSYVVIGRRGDVGLGVKPYPMVRGDHANGPKDTVLLNVRLRSAKLPKNTEQASEGNVTSMDAHKEYGLTEAWPNIEFLRADEDRASTTIGLFVRGEAKDEEGLLALLQKLHDGDYVERLATKLIDMAGDHAIERPSLLASYLREAFGVTDSKLEKLQKAVAAKKAHTDEVEGLVDNEVVNTAVLFEKLKTSLQALEEPEEGEDQDAEGVGEGDGSNDA
jgi:hypothetical protein